MRATPLEVARALEPEVDACKQEKEAHVNSVRQWLRARCGHGKVRATQGDADEADTALGTVQKSRTRENTKHAHPVTSWCGFV